MKETNCVGLDYERVPGAEHKAVKKNKKGKRKRKFPELPNNSPSPGSSKQVRPQNQPKKFNSPPGGKTAAGNTRQNGQEPFNKKSGNKGGGQLKRNRGGKKRKGKKNSPKGTGGVPKKFLQLAKDVGTL